MEEVQTSRRRRLVSADLLALRSLETTIGGDDDAGQTYAGIPAILHWV